MAGKKKKKSGKKSGKKGGKRKGEPEMTFKEAIIAYRIGLLEKQLEDWRFEEKELEDKRLRNIERKERLLNEQHAYMKMLLRESRTLGRKDAKAKPVDKKQVVVAMMEKWDTAKQEDTKLHLLDVEVAKVDKAILQMQKDLEYWLRYRDEGSSRHAKQILLLEKELRDMQETYDEMKVLLDRDIVKTKEETIQETEKTLYETKFMASENAMASIDKQGRQEVLDNDWMKKELQLYQKEVDLLQQEVEVMENENLEIMSEMFDCKVEDLLISRSFFMTQFEEAESLKDGGILEVDLANVSLLERKPAEGNVVRGRPKSAVLAQVEEKVASVARKQINSDDDSDSDNLSIEDYEDSAEAIEQYDGGSEPRGSEDEDPFNNYYNFIDENIDQFLQLGPLELKMLSITGSAMPIHIQNTSSKEELRARECNPTEWPVTQPMLKDVAVGKRAQAASNH